MHWFSLQSKTEKVTELYCGIRKRMVCAIRSNFIIFTVGKPIRRSYLGDILFVHTKFKHIFIQSAFHIGIHIRLFITVE